jgi:hypothetical protein
LSLRDLERPVANFHGGWLVAVGAGEAALGED